MQPCKRSLSVKLFFNFLLKPFSTPFLNLCKLCEIYSMGCQHCVKSMQPEIFKYSGGGGEGGYINTAIEISQSLKAHSHESGLNPVSSNPARD